MEVSCPVIGEILSTVVAETTDLAAWITGRPTAPKADGDCVGQ